MKDGETCPARPFWLDWEYDRANADTGTPSRYGNYLSQCAKSFAEIWTDDPSVEFAALAWRIAAGPIMDPPLVRSHRRISGATLGRSGWNGEMIADVRLISPRPQLLGTAQTADGAYLRDHRLDAWDTYAGIGEEDLTRNSYPLTEVRLLWQLPEGTLPKIKEVPTGSDARFHRAAECLNVLVWALNREVGPVIEQLEAGS